MIVTITALPRSGTAFLSQVLSLHPQCIAYHELAAYDHNWRNTLYNAQKKYTYVINSTTYSHLPGMWFDKSEMLIKIRNSAEESLSSLARIGIPIKLSTLEEQERLLDNFHPVKTAIYLREHVFSLHYLFSIWLTVFGMDGFPEDKIEQMLKLRITHMNINGIKHG